jgi:multiple sugar transport system permease protein
MIAVQQRLHVPRSARAMQRRTGYLVAAICVALCTIMIMPLALTILASLKTTLEAAALPPTYVPHELSVDSYVKLWNYQAGLLTYVANSGITACLTILFCLLLTIPAGYALARFPVPGKEVIFVILLLALIIPYQALLTPIFFMFIQLKLTNSLIGAYGDPAAV